MQISRNECVFGKWKTGKEKESSRRAIMDYGKWLRASILNKISFKIEEEDREAEGALWIIIRKVFSQNIIQQFGENWIFPDFPQIFAKSWNEHRCRQQSRSQIYCIKLMKMLGKQHSINTFFLLGKNYLSV